MQTENDEENRDALNKYCLDLTAQAWRVNWTR